MIKTTHKKSSPTKRARDSLSTSKRKKREAPPLRKAPQAPKRFRSSYICFFTANQPEIKKELGDEATVGMISRRSAYMWKMLSPEDRQHWDNVAAKDKARYLAEKASYAGPWQVPYKRTKKDPSAPKRPMSAFLHFTQGRRSQIKKENPDMKNTEISKILGGQWRKSTEEERKPYVETEKAEREKYKIAMSKWKEQNEKPKKEESEQQLPQPCQQPTLQKSYPPHKYHRHQQRRSSFPKEYSSKATHEKHMEWSVHDSSYSDFQPPVTQSVFPRYDEPVLLNQSCALHNYEVPQYYPPSPFPNMHSSPPSFDDDGYHYDHGSSPHSILPVKDSSMA